VGDILTIERVVAQIPLLQPLLPEELCGFFEPGTLLDARHRACYIVVTGLHYGKK
jgi:hypothetical protein